MKKIIILFALAAMIVGCDNKGKTLSYTPEMASFSNEFDFDPLRGPVKHFSQTLLNEKGEVVKRVDASLSTEGCFNQLEFHDIETNTGANLVLDANYYLDAVSREKKVKLQGKCQLAALPAVNMTYDTDDKGFVVAAHTDAASVVYRYDEDGYPLGKTTTIKSDVLDITSKTDGDREKKLDYTSKSTLNGKVIGVVTEKCEYDSYYNPLECQLDMTDESVEPQRTDRYTIKNSIDYY